MTIHMKSENLILLTETQAAEVLQLAKGTLRNARVTGSLNIPFLKLSPNKRGKVRYSLSALTEWAAARTQTNTRQGFTNINACCDKCSKLSDAKKDMEQS